MSAAAKRYSVDEVTRLSPLGGSATYCREVEKVGGRYVLASDYEALEALLRQAREAIDSAAVHAHYAPGTGAMLTAALKAIDAALTP